MVDKIIKSLHQQGFGTDEIVVLTCRGINRTLFSELDNLGGHSLKRFTGEYDVNGDQVYTILLGSAVSLDPGYSGLDPEDVQVINLDDVSGMDTMDSGEDAAGIIVEAASGLTTAEAGDKAKFTIVLTSEPTEDVTLSLSSSDEMEGTVSPSSVTFTSKNYRKAKTVTVSGVDDDVDDGDQFYTIIIGPAVTGDSTYTGRNPEDVGVTNKDNDIAGIIMEPVRGLTTAEPMSAATFSVVLTSEPTADVNISLIITNGTEGSLWRPLDYQAPKKGWRAWVAAHPGVVWTALAVGGGVSIWALVGEEEETVGQPPPFPVVP